MVPGMPRPQGWPNDRTLRHLKAASAYHRANGYDLFDRMEAFYVQVEPLGSKVFRLRFQLDDRRGPLAGCSAAIGRARSV